MNRNVNENFGLENMSSGRQMENLGESYGSTLNNSKWSERVDSSMNTSGNNSRNINNFAGVRDGSGRGVRRSRNRDINPLRRTESRYFIEGIEHKSIRERWVSPFLKFFRKKKNRQNFISYAFLIICIYLVLNITMLIENIAGFQVLAVLNIVVTLSDFLGAIFGLWCTMCFSRKTMNLVHTGGLCVFAVTFVVLQTFKLATLNVTLVILGRAVGWEIIGLVGGICFIFWCVGLDWLEWVLNIWG